MWPHLLLYFPYYVIWFGDLICAWLLVPYEKIQPSFLQLDYFIVSSSYEFLCFDNEASRDMYVGLSVGLFRHNFQKSLNDVV